MKTSWIATFAVLTGAAFAAAPAVAQTPATLQAPVAGTYELVEVSGGALPATVEQSAECVERVTKGTLTLEEDGDWRIELTEEETCGTEVSEETEDEEGDFTVEGAEIDFQPGEEEEFTDVDPEDDLDLDELVSGTHDGETLRIRAGESGTVIVFRRVQS